MFFCVSFLLFSLRSEPCIAWTYIFSVKDNSIFVCAWSVTSLAVTTTFIKFWWKNLIVQCYVVDKCAHVTVMYFWSRATHVISLRERIMHLFRSPSINICLALPVLSLSLKVDFVSPLTEWLPLPISCVDSTWRPSRVLSFLSKLEKPHGALTAWPREGKFIKNCRRANGLTHVHRVAPPGICWR